MSVRRQPGRSALAAAAVLLALCRPLVVSATPGDALRAVLAPAHVPPVAEECSIPFNPSNLTPCSARTAA